MAKTVQLFMPVLQFFDDNGDELNGGTLTFSEAGSATAKDTYADSAQAVTNPNPITLDTAGRPDNGGSPIQIWLDGSYKLVVKDSSGNTIRTEDNLTSLAEATGYAAKTTNYTVTSDDYGKLITMDASGGARTFTLLAAATAGSGFQIRLKKIDSSTNAVTIDGNASETIDGAATRDLTFQYQALNLICDGSNWHVDRAEDQQTFLDTNGNEVLEFVSTASAVNHFKMTNAATGNPPKLGIESESNIGMLIDDSNDNEAVEITSTASAVNHINVTNAATGNAPIVSSKGDDANIDLQLNPKGTGNVTVSDGTDITKKVSFEASGATTAKTATITTAHTDDRTITLPDATDTLVGKATTDTFTNKTFDANATGNSLSNVDVADLANGTDGELITWDAAGAPATVAVGTAGHLLTSNGAGAPPTFQALAAGSSGGWAYVSTSTASASSSLDFTTLTATSKVYKLVLRKLQMATDATELQLRMSNDNGSSFVSTSNYSHESSIGSNVDDGEIRLCLDVGTAGTEDGVSGEIYIFNTNTASENCWVTFSLSYMNSTAVCKYAFGAGYSSDNLGNDINAVDAIRLFSSSGNLASGVVELYSLVNS